MINRELSYNEMVDFINYVSDNDEHDTFISVSKQGEVVEEISCTSRLSLIHGFRKIKFKSLLSNEFVSFKKNKIQKILYVIYDFHMKQAYIEISDKKKTALIMINRDVLDKCPLTNT